MRVDESDPVSRGMLVDERGWYRFTALPAGDYRLELVRVGFERVRSPILSLREGEVLSYDLHGAEVPVILPEVVVRPPECLDLTRLATDPVIATLWGEARKGIEGSLAFEYRYQFSRILRQEIQLDRRFRGDQRGTRIDTLLVVRDSVAVREGRRQEARRTQGWGESGGLLLTIPDERDLLDDAFLREHCIEPKVGYVDGALVVRFHPLQRPGGRVEIAGAIWLDEDTHLVRRLELEWFEGARELGRGRIDYADVRIEGAQLRLPTGGHLEARSRGSLLVRGASAELTFTYSAFQAVPSHD